VLRGLQNHDLEHLLSGGGFDIIGEMAPISMRWGSLFRHLDPELAGVLNVPTHLLFLSYLSSTMLYSPAAYPTLQHQMHRGWSIGQASGPYFMNRFEDFFPLSLDEARRGLGIRNADDLDTRTMSALVMRQPVSA
jgi:ubiquinone biosynthesis protein COQ4